MIFPSVVVLQTILMPVGSYLTNPVLGSARIVLGEVSLTITLEDLSRGISHVSPVRFLFFFMLCLLFQLGHDLLRLWPSVSNVGRGPRTADRLRAGMRCLSGRLLTS